MTARALSKILPTLKPADPARLTKSAFDVLASKIMRDVARLFVARAGGRDSGVEEMALAIGVTPRRAKTFLYRTAARVEFGEVMTALAAAVEARAEDGLAKAGQYQSALDLLHSELSGGWDAVAKSGSGGTAPVSRRRSVSERATVHGGRGSVSPVLKALSPRATPVTGAGW